MKLTCSDCIFSDFEIVDVIRDDGNHEDMPHMFCRRYPPQMVGTSMDSAMPAWPLVHENEWCGELIRKRSSNPT